MRLFASIVILCCAPTLLAQEIRFDNMSGDAAFRVALPNAAIVRAMAPERWREILTVYVDVAGDDIPPVVGSYRMDGDVLVFEPRYPPSPGVTYRAVFRSDGNEIVRTFAVPDIDRTPTTVVEHVYPSTGVLPENQLKLYIHFSSPMSRAEAYRNIRLLDGEGDDVYLPFLELDQELWTRDFRRFTILFDPGRIKTGLVPNVEDGMPIVEGNTYTLVIDAGWKDANGRFLKEEYRKTFRVGPFDDVAPRVSDWRLAVPKAGTTEPVEVVFPEPMDRGLLDRLLAIVNDEGNTLEGSVTVDREETRWSFRPSSEWLPGNYELIAGAELEDLAGNALNGLFEVDVFEVDQIAPVGDTESLPFTIPLEGSSPGC